MFVADVRSERLFREAEDDFFYFKNTESAVNKIKQALTYAPCMLKAILMLANIFVLEGNLTQALELYKKAETLSMDNIKVLAGLANIYEMLNENDKACEYCVRALNSIKDISSPLKMALIELESIVLMKMNKYDDAKRLIDDSGYLLSSNELVRLQAGTVQFMKYKQELDERMKKHNIKVVK